MSLLLQVTTASCSPPCSFERDRTSRDQLAGQVTGQVAVEILEFCRTPQCDYAGASDTIRELLYHWFERDHYGWPE